MARARRAWSALRPEIRRLIRETSETAPFWTNALLLDLFNQSMDLWVTRMQEVDEGWFTDIFYTNLVANQDSYTLQEGTDRVKRVLLVWNPATSTEVTVPLARAERWGVATRAGNGGPNAYRLVGNSLYIEPMPTESRASGLRIEIDNTPDRLTADADKLDLAFPSTAETLLIYETAVAALGVEQSQGMEGEAGWTSWLEKQRDRYAAVFNKWIEERSTGLTFSRAFYLGD